MLPARWWLEGRTWRRAPAPAMGLQALYDYAYVGADGRPVAIAAGERFRLLRQANEDWWQVRREGASRRTRPIFVPATYVAPVPPEGMTEPGSGAKRASMELPSSAGEC